MQSTKQERKIEETVIASPGIAYGKSIKLCYEGTIIPEYSIQSTEIKNELNRFEKALEKTKNELLALKEKFEQKDDTTYLADLVTAHIHILEGMTLKENIKQMLNKTKKNIEHVTYKTFDKIIDRFSNMKNELFRERASDLIEIRSRLMANLTGNKRITIDEITHDGILIAGEIPPTETAIIDSDKIYGFITERGGITSHSSIIARGIGIPALVGVENVLDIIEEGDIVILDGLQGSVIINPTEQTLELYKSRKLKQVQTKTDLSYLKEKEAKTLDGIKLDVLSNSEVPEELKIIEQSGAEGIGLLRSEFVFLRSRTIPTEDEQFNFYKQMIEFMNPKPVTIRTLDLGGDKFKSGLIRHTEANPFLGWRSIRFCLDNPDLFKSQIKAILRSSHYGNVKMMFPLITEVEELIEALEIVDAVKSELTKENIPFDKEMKIGTMIETPASIFIEDGLSGYVDFFSIGTNDLVQYSLAADRGNDKVSKYYNPYHPAIIKLINLAVTKANENNIDISICGEIAGNAYFTVLFIGMGVLQLSMIPTSIPTIKKVIRGLTKTEAETVLKKVLNMQKSLDVKDFLTQFFKNKFPEIE